MIDIKHLRYFIAVAEKRHFGQAAESLHITQPPLSRQIAALEEILGVQLLHRHSRNVELTAAGTQFLKDSKAVLMALDQACHNARLAHQGELGTLKIGFMMHAAFSSVPQLVRQFSLTYPDIQLQLKETLPTHMIEAMLDGHYDAVITFNPGQLRNVASTSIHREALCLAVPANHALADKHMITPEMLVQMSLIATPAVVAPALHNAIQSFFHAAGFAMPAIKLEVQLQQTIISLVAEGVGIALVPESLKTLAMPAVKYCALKNAPVVEQVLAWRTDNLNPALPLLIANASSQHK